MVLCWHRSGFKFYVTDLHVLVSCCLLRVSADDCTLSMHDHLRDLAYRIFMEMHRQFENYLQGALQIKISKPCEREAAQSCNARACSAGTPRKRSQARCGSCTLYLLCFMAFSLKTCQKARKCLQ